MVRRKIPATARKGLVRCHFSELKRRGVRLEQQSLDDILKWANNQITDIKSLKAKDSFRKEFIGNLAHELKTPLFNIQGFILTLIESDLKDEELVRRFWKKPTTTSAA